LPELESLASILKQSNKEIIDFWDSILLSPILFVDTPFHDPLSTPEGLHNAIIAAIVWQLASSPHLPVPATTIDRINSVAIHRKLPAKLKPFPTNHLQQHSQSCPATPSDSVVTAMPTLTDGTVPPAVAVTALLAALPATAVALVVTAPP
jgi:hypothetical protein